jgi:hypothetical protein
MMTDMPWHHQPCIPGSATDLSIKCNIRIPHPWNEIADRAQQGGVLLMEGALQACDAEQGSTYRFASDNVHVVTPITAPATR